MTVPVKIRAALLLQAAWFATVPALNETFYWLSGMPYTWAAALSLLCLSGLLHFLKSRRRGVLFYLLAFAVFFNAMILEPTCVTQMIVLFFLTLYFLRRRDGCSALTAGILLLAAAGGFLAMYFAPGTAIRMAGGGRNVLQALFVAAVFGGMTAIKFFTKPIVYIFLLFLPDIAENADAFCQKNSSALRGWHIFVLVAMVAPLQQAIAGWATGAGLPARAEGLAVWLMAAAWLFLWSFAYRNEGAFARVRSLSVYRWRWILLALALVLNSNFLSLIRDLRLAPVYAAEQQRREALITKQKAEGREDVIVPALSVRPRLLFFSDIRPFPGDWKNQSFSEYWGVRSAAAIPEPLLNDEPALSDFLAGKLSGLEALAEECDVEAQFMLGEIFDTTFAPANNVAKDNKAAAKWYLMAARQGSAHACRRLVRLPWAWAWRKAILPPPSGS